MQERSEAERRAIWPYLNVATWRRERSDRAIQQIRQNSTAFHSNPAIRSKRSTSVLSTRKIRPIYSHPIPQCQVDNFRPDTLFNSGIVHLKRIHGDSHRHGHIFTLLIHILCHQNRCEDNCKNTGRHHDTTRLPTYNNNNRQRNPIHVRSSGRHHTRTGHPTTTCHNKACPNNRHPGTLPRIPERSSEDLNGRKENNVAPTRTCSHPQL